MKIPGMCFRLHGNKHSPVHNTAAAALRQLVTMLFDRAVAELQPNKEPTSPSVPQNVAPDPEGKLAPSTLDAYMLIHVSFQIFDLHGCRLTCTGYI